MIISYNISTSWDSLNPWQLKKIAWGYHHLQSKARSVFFFAILFLKANTWREWYRFFFLLREFPIVDLLPFTEFLHKECSRTIFPKVRGWDSPGVRLSQITIGQFATVLEFYSKYQKTNNHKDLMRFCATLYKKKNKPFSIQDCGVFTAENSKKTEEFWVSIQMAFDGSMTFITRRFDRVFSKKQNSKKSVSRFKNSILSVAAIENPFGKYSEIEQTNIYDFFFWINEKSSKR